MWVFKHIFLNSTCSNTFSIKLYRAGNGLKMLIIILKDKKNIGFPDRFQNCRFVSQNNMMNCMKCTTFPVQKQVQEFDQFRTSVWVYYKLNVSKLVDYKTYWQNANFFFYWMNKKETYRFTLHGIYAKPNNDPLI